jgi:hypothetical protein
MVSRYFLLRFRPPFGYHAGFYKELFQGYGTLFHLYCLLYHFHMFSVSDSFRLSMIWIGIIIAKNTGWDSAIIEKIKNHVFFTEHDLGYEFPSRFDPDYNMAISWQRLIEGSAIQESEQFDYAALIKHREEQ